jgi:hypothetical protein
MGGGSPSRTSPTRATHACLRSPSTAPPGFGFVQLPADISGIVVNGDVNVPAVTVAACGLRYHVAGFAYSLAGPLRVTAAFVSPRLCISPGWPGSAREAG